MYLDVHPRIRMYIPEFRRTCTSQNRWHSIINYANLMALVIEICEVTSQFREGLTNCIATSTLAESGSRCDCGFPPAILADLLL